MAKYFISPTGSDSNNGLSAATAFATLAKVSTVIIAGDEVEVGAGSYLNQPTAYFSNINGSATVQTKIYAAPNTEPLLYYPNVYAIQILSCSYISFYGLTLLGNSPSLSYADAYAKKDVFDAKYSASGFLTRDSHHVRIKANTVRDFPGGGILFSDCDYSEVLNNIVSGCCRYTPYGAQAVSFLRSFNSPGAVSGAERITAKYNHVYDNLNLIPWSTAFGGNGLINEGAGIYNDTTKNANGGGLYTGVANFSYNVCTYNGGAGIHVFAACPTTVSKNFCNSNTRSFNDRGEILVNYAPDSSVTGNECGTDSNLNWLFLGNSANVVATGNTVRGTTLQNVYNSPGANVSGNTFL